VHVRVLVLVLVRMLMRVRMVRVVGVRMRVRLGVRLWRRGVRAVRQGGERDAGAGAARREGEVGAVGRERVRRVGVERVPARAARPDVAVRADAAADVEADAVRLGDRGEHDGLAARDGALRVVAHLRRTARRAAGPRAAGAAVAEVLERVGDDRRVDAGVHVAAPFSAAGTRVERRRWHGLRDVRDEPARAGEEARVRDGREDRLELGLHRLERLGLRAQEKWRDTSA